RGAREIRLVNRTQGRAQALAAEFGGPIQGGPWGDPGRALQGASMLVNATSPGMQGQPALDLPPDPLPQAALGYDIIYIPRETPLLQAARARGNATLNGLGMLLHQARPAWKSWFGIDTEVTPELRALLEATL